MRILHHNGNRITEWLQGIWRVLETTSWAPQQAGVVRSYSAQLREHLAALLARSYRALSSQKAAQLLNLEAQQATPCEALLAPVLPRPCSDGAA